MSKYKSLKIYNKFLENKVKDYEYRKLNKNIKINDVILFKVIDTNKKTLRQVTEVSYVKPIQAIKNEKCKASVNFIKSTYFNEKYILRFKTKPLI